MRSQHTIHRLFVIAGSLSTMLFVLLASEQARAQAPMRLSFVNAASSGGGEAHTTINNFLKKSGDIEATHQDEVWSRAREYDLSQKDFRSGSLREKNAGNFRKIMRELDLEAILILDVFSRGRKLQVVVIGPGGTEIADVRQDIDDGEISKSGAKSVLKRCFKDLVPRVKEFRDAGGWDAVEEEEEEEEAVSLIESEEDGDTGEDGEELSLKEKALRKKYGDMTALDPGVTLTVAFLVGKRTINMTANTGFELTHDSPFALFFGRVAGVFLRITGNSSAGAELFGGYAPFTTIFTDPNDTSQKLEFQSQYARLGGQARYIYALTKSAHVEALAGAEALSITIDQNPFYTGNRYIAARAGARLGYRVGPVLLDISAVVLPVLGVNNSSGAYGETGLNLGLEGNAGLSFKLSDDLGASVGYTFQTVSATYENPVVVDAPIEATDVLHTGTVGLTWSL